MRCFLYHPVRLACLIGLLLVLAAYPLRSPAATPAGKLLVLGDSISAAYGMSLEQGWVALLAQRLEGRYPTVEVVNASISGDTTDGGLRRLPPLLARHQPAAVVVELGGNDLLRGFNPTLIANNLTRIAELATDAGAQVLLLPMVPPDNYGPAYARSIRDAYLAAARVPGARLGAFIFAGMKGDASMRQADDLHPTPAAQPRMLDNVWGDITALLDAL